MESKNLNEKLLVEEVNDDFQEDQCECKSNSTIIKEITNITFPAIICQFCLVLPNTINIWAAGQMNNAMVMDIVGLGMGITEAIGMAIFLGLNGALY